MRNLCLCCSKLCKVYWFPQISLNIMVLAALQSFLPRIVSKALRYLAMLRFSSLVPGPAIFGRKGLSSEIPKQIFQPFYLLLLGLQKQNQPESMVWLLQTPAHHPGPTLEGNHPLPPAPSSPFVTSHASFSPGCTPGTMRDALQQTLHLSPATDARGERSGGHAEPGKLQFGSATRTT